MSMYVRLKRKNQTIFLHIDPSDNFFQIKQRVGEIFNLDPANILIIATDKKKELLDLATVSDQEIKNDDVLYLVFAKENGGGFEELVVETLARYGETLEDAN